MEIKFRGLSHSSGWVYGSYIHSKRFLGCGNEHRIFNQDTGLESDVIGETVGQFTGLTDKYGKEIYSGDIVKCLSATEPEDKGFICLYKDYRWKFNNVYYPDDDYYGTVNYNYIQQNCEIIGNIFDNPELLNK